MIGQLLDEMGMPIDQEPSYMGAIFGIHHRRLML
jgi:hypothetical protein